LSGLGEGGCGFDQIPPESGAITPRSRLPGAGSTEPEAVTNVFHPAGQDGRVRAFPPGQNRKDKKMLWTIVVILLVLWLLGFTVLHVGSLIHLLLVIALVVVVVRLIQGRRAI
jgi:hypothetical protein